MEPLAIAGKRKLASSFRAPFHTGPLSPKLQGREDLCVALRREVGISWSRSLKLFSSQLPFQKKIALSNTQLT